MDDRRRPVRGELRSGAVLPDHLVALAGDAQERGAGAVRLGDQHFVADHHRRRGVDALESRRAPGIEEALGAGRGVEGEQSAAREVEAETLAAHGADDRAGVARELVARSPAHLAGALVEGDEARAVAGDSTAVDRRRAGRTAADGHDQQLAVDQRGGGDAEEVLHEAEVALGVDLPDQAAVLGAAALEAPVDAVGVDAIAVDDRARARAVGVAVVVLVLERRLDLPERRAGGGVHRDQPRAVAGRGRRGRAVRRRRPASRSPSPTSRCQTSGGPPSFQSTRMPGLGRVAVAVGAEKRRPVFRRGGRRRRAPRAGAARRGSSKPLLAPSTRRNGLLHWRWMKQHSVIVWFPPSSIARTSQMYSVRCSTPRDRHHGAVDRRQT